MAALKTLLTEAEEIAEQIATLGTRLHTLTDTLRTAGLDHGRLRHVADELDGLAGIVRDDMELAPSEDFCVFEDCDQEPAHDSPYCAGHREQEARIASDKGAA